MLSDSRAFGAPPLPLAGEGWGGGFYLGKAPPLCLSPAACSRKRAGREDARGAGARVSSISQSTIHATAVLVGARAVLIRGASGSGKTTLALRLLAAGAAGQLPFARLVADDRVYLDVVAGRLIARAPEAIAGMIEVRGEGIRHIPYEPRAVVGWAVDLAVPDAERLPPAVQGIEIGGVRVPHFAFPPCADPLAVLLAAFRVA